VGSGLLGRESTGGLDEAGRLIKAIGFASKAGLEGKESGGGDIREVAAGEFVANAAEVFAEQFDAGATGQRQQPFTLLLHSLDGRLLVRCISPVGRVFLETDDFAVQETTAKQSVRVGAISTEEDRTYDLTVEDDVLLSDDATTDAARIAWLIRRVTLAADRLEQAHLPGRDEPLSTFKADLEKEMCDED